MEQEKVHKSAVADAVTSAVAGPRRSPTRQTNNTDSDVESKFSDHHFVLMSIYRFAKLFCQGYAVS